MREKSVFVGECLCGRTFETPSREYVCEFCKRQIVLEWGRHDDPEREKSKTQPNGAEDLP
jgi:hypothetical protein